MTHAVPTRPDANLPRRDARRYTDNRLQPRRDPRDTRAARGQARDGRRRIAPRAGNPGGHASRLIPFASSEVEMPIDNPTLRGVSSSPDTHGSGGRHDPLRPDPKRAV